MVDILRKDVAIIFLIIGFTFVIYSIFGIPAYDQQFRLIVGLESVIGSLYLIFRLHKEK